MELVIIATISVVMSQELEAVTPVLMNRCGPVALYSCSHAIGRPLPLSEIEAAGPSGNQKWTFADLQSAAQHFRFRTECRRYPRNLIAFLPGQAAGIARVFLRNGESHYVTIVESSGDVVVIDDFPHEPTAMTAEALRNEFGWDGSVLLVFTDDFFGAKVTTEGNLRTSYSAAALLFAVSAVLIGTRRVSVRTVAATNRTSRHAFTIIEVLVSLGIIALLMALTLPAVQSVRARARKMECANHLHQIGLAMSGFESSFNCYPNPDQLPRVALEITPYQRATFAPHVGLLPWLDQAAVEARIDFRSDDPQRSDPAASVVNAELLETSIAVFKCPADTVPTGGNSYRACTGTSPSLHTTPQLDSKIAALSGWHNGAKQSSRDVTDGLSNTVFFSERTVGDEDVSNFTPFRDVAFNATGRLMLPDDAVAACTLSVPARPAHASFPGSTWLYFGYFTTAYNQILEPNSRVIDCTTDSQSSGVAPGSYAPRSLHHGGVNVLMGDGSSRFISSSIDRTLWRSLGSISGHETIGDF